MDCIRRAGSDNLRDINPIWDPIAEGDGSSFGGADRLGDEIHEEIYRRYRRGESVRIGGSLWAK